MAFSPGDSVHVASLGKGVVREARSRDRYVVELKGRLLTVDAAQLTRIGERRTRQRGSLDAASSVGPDVPTRAHAPASIDLHGLTSDEAIKALDAFLNDAILAGLPEVRVIHGRSGGRLKAAVHTRLKSLAVVRGVRGDPANPGVTLVAL